MSDHEPRAQSDDHGVAEVNEALNALPELAAPDRLWDGVRRRIDAAPARRARSRFVPFALAASLLVAAALAVLLGIEPADRGAADVDIAALLERSRNVEAERRARPVVLSPSGVERVLQVRIGGIDALLNEQLLQGTDPSARQALLRERVELMEDLKHIERYRRDELFQQAVF
ncbi:MAG: hypothetical protein OXH15_03585 [Gammaproteobacteria bacterium]|nr:hypothetical protein [Gammaproteobacteria bacterium]